MGIADSSWGDNGLIQAPPGLWGWSKLDKRMNMKETVAELVFQYYRRWQSSCITPILYNERRIQEVEGHDFTNSVAKSVNYNFYYI